MMYFLKGLLIGLSIAAPVGPIGLLCISRTIQKGRLAGFFTGMGAATADGIYGFIAAFGLTLITNFLVDQSSWIRFVGGVFLLYLAYKTFKSKVGSNKSEEKDSYGLLKMYATTILLTLTNPTTILTFIGVYAGLGIGSESKSYLDSGFMVLGVFLGSALWWLILSVVVDLARHKMSEKHLNLINKFSGLLIFSFALAALISLL